MIFSLIFLRTSHYEFCCLRHVSVHFNALRQFSTCDSPAENVLPEVSKLLSEENKRDCLKRLQAFKTISPRNVPPESVKKAAVLVPFCIVNDELSLLYTLRKADLKRHRGQVSFPGGVQDTTDSSLIETALRETEEELGIIKSSVEVWGVGSYIIGMEFTVLPVLGFLGDLNVKDLKHNPGEVELPFVVSLKHFCDETNCRSTQFRLNSNRGFTLPVYINAEYRIWGITALITHLVLTCLLPNHYKHTVKYVKPIVFRDPIL